MWTSSKYLHIFSKRILQMNIFKLQCICVQNCQSISFAEFYPRKQWQWWSCIKKKELNLTNFLFNLCIWWRHKKIYQHASNILLLPKYANHSLKQTLLINTSIATTILEEREYIICDITISLKLLMNTILIVITISQCLST